MVVVFRLFGNYQVPGIRFLVVVRGVEISKASLTAALIIIVLYVGAQAAWKRSIGRDLEFRRGLFPSWRNFGLKGSPVCVFVVVAFLLFWPCLLVSSFVVLPLVCLVLPSAASRSSLRLLALLEGLVHKSKKVSVVGSSRTCRVPTCSMVILFRVLQILAELCCSSLAVPPRSTFAQFPRALTAVRAARRAVRIVPSASCLQAFLRLTYRLSIVVLARQQRREERLHNCLWYLGTGLSRQTRSWPPPCTRRVYVGCPGL